MKGYFGLLLGAAMLVLAGGVARPSLAADGPLACAELAAGDFNLGDVDAAKDFVVQHGDCIPDFLDTDVFDPLAAALTACVAFSDKCQQLLSELSNLSPGSTEFTDKLNELLGALPDGSVKDGINSVLGNASVGQEYFTCASAVALSGAGEKLKDIVHDLQECGKSIGAVIGAIWTGIKDVAKCSEYIITLGQSGSCGGDDDKQPVLVDCTQLPFGDGYQDKGSGVYYQPESNATCYCPSPMEMHSYQATGCPSSPGDLCGYNLIYCECPYSQTQVALGYCKCPINNTILQPDPKTGMSCQPCPGSLQVVKDACGCKDPNLKIRTSSNGTPFCGCPNDNDGLINGTCHQCPAPHCVINKQLGTYKWVTSKVVGTKCVSSDDGFLSSNWCGPGQQPVESSCSCGPSCASGSIVPAGGGACQVCGPNSHAVYQASASSLGSCPECGDKEHSKAASLTCTPLNCSSGSHAGGHLCCPNGFHADGSVCCRNGFKANGTTCVYNGNGPTPKNPQQVGVVCEEGASICCPLGAHTDGNRCVPGSQHVNNDGSCCPASFVGDANGCCPENTTPQWSGKSGEQVRVCVSDIPSGGQQFQGPQGTKPTAVSTPSTPATKSCTVPGVVINCPPGQKPSLFDPSVCVASDTKAIGTGLQTGPALGAPAQKLIPPQTSKPSVINCPPRTHLNPSGTGCVPDAGVGNFAAPSNTPRAPASGASSAPLRVLPSVRGRQ